MPSCRLNRSTPRICTPEIDKNGNFPKEVVDNPALRERMRNLLNLIMTHFESLDDAEDNNEENQ